MLSNEMSPAHQASAQQGINAPRNDAGNVVKRAKTNQNLVL
jgi:hypothetical protein